MCLLPSLGSQLVVTMRRVTVTWRFTVDALYHASGSLDALADKR
jgi:hypothetical protein